MCNLILDWLYENAAAILISAIASLIISKIYYHKANRESVLMSVIFPIVKLLNSRFYTRKDYEALFEINSSYAVKYLRKKERRKLLELLSNYRDVCKFSQESADTESIMLYYSYKLKENGINPRPVLIESDNGEIIAEDFPPYYDDLQNYVYKIISSDEFFESPKVCAIKISNAFTNYVKKHYDAKTKITFFDDYSIDKVIESSEITQKWDSRFQIVNKSKEEFLELPICKKVTKIINKSSVNEYVKNKKSIKANSKQITDKITRAINALKDTTYSSIYVVLCLIEQSVVLEAIKDLTNLINDEKTRILIYAIVGCVSLVLLIITIAIMINYAGKQIEQEMKKHTEKGEDLTNKESNKIIESATMIGYASLLLCFITWFSEFEITLSLKWLLIFLAITLGIIMPLIIKKRH